MRTKTSLAIIAIVAASAAIALASILSTPALAAKDSGQQGVDKADSAIHDHQGSGSNTDNRFHFGTCQGGFGAGGFNC